MITLKERFIVDENGQRVGVLLDIEDYRQLLEALEELEAIRAYDAAKASGDEAVRDQLSRMVRSCAFFCSLARS